MPTVAGLVRVVTILLDNAQRHGGGVVRIAVTQRSGHARLEVDDAGPGIPDDLKQQVFERFPAVGMPETAGKRPAPDSASLW